MRETCGSMPSASMSTGAVETMMLVMRRAGWLRPPSGLLDVLPDQPGSLGDAADVPGREAGRGQKNQAKGRHGNRILDDEKDAHQADQNASGGLASDGQSTHDSGGVIVEGENEEELVLPETTRRHLVAFGNRYGLRRED